MATPTFEEVITSLLRLVDPERFADRDEFVAKYGEMATAEQVSSLHDALRPYILRRMKDDGRCVVFSSHVMQEVSALCDHIVIIAAGRVVAAGSEAALLAKAGANSLEDAFVSLTGSAQGLV